ncbi:MAG: hypothetical protein ACJ763_11865 [Bdellovibrionia bacterium]
MFELIRRYWSRPKTPQNKDPHWSKADNRIKRPSEEDYDAQRLKRENPNKYVSDSFTDPTNRGGPLGAENEMPEGGDSTRGMSKGPSSKSPMPQQQGADHKKKAAG